MKENKKKRGVKKANTGKAAKRAHAPAKVNKTVPKKAVEKPNVSKLGTYLTYGILALIIIGTFFYIINIAYKQALVGRAYQFVLEDTTVIPGQPLSVDLVSGQPESVNLNIQGPAEKALMDVSGTGEDIEISVGAEGVYSSLGNMEDEKLVIREFDNITEEIVELPKAVTITVPRNAIISKAEINTELASLGPITGSIILITGRQVENETQYCNDCASRTSGSEYRCNSNGAFDSNGVYICTCTSNYATACTYNGNNVCDEEETSQCETRDCGSLEQKNNCINQCIYKVCGWDFTYACDAGKNIGSDYLCSCYSGENCRATQCGNGICESSTGEAYASETAENCPQDCTNRICSKACLFRSPGSGWRCNSDGSFNSSGYWCECIDKCEFRTDAPNQTQTQQCSDSTLYNQCSLAKPKYCYNGNLIDKCSVCGCESGFNCENEACVLPPPAPANQTNETPSVAGGGGGGQNITTNVTINGTQPATGGGGELVNITINQTNATTGGGGETANVTINQTTSGGGGGGEITTNITQTNKTISVPEVNVTPAPVPENRTETLAIYLNNNPISTGTINLKDYIKTDCGGEYCTTVLEFASNLPASLKLSSLAIEYSLPVKDFSAEINSYCSEYPCSVPVEIKSKSDGKVTLSNFDISIASPTKPETGTAKRFTVKPYLVYPADKEMYPEYETAVKEYLTELQEWYASNVGATFEMDELKVVRSSYDYLTMRCGSNPSKECIGNPAKLDGNWGYYINTAIHNGTEKWETETAALIFSAGGGGFAGANLYPDHTGFAITGDWVLEPISGTANKWGIPCNYSDGWQCSGGVPKGSPAHELGHAFGLGHPAQENSSKSIMGWHGNYPNVSFLPYEIEYLKKSPFFKETEIRKNITCKDSDGGEVYDMKGITKGIYGSPGGIIYNGKKYEEGDYVELEDYCYDNIKINEFLCFKKSDGGLYVTQGGINCPNGCSDGACVKAPTNETQPWPHPYNFVADSNAIKTDDYFLISNKGFSPRVLRLTGIKKSSTENSIKVWNADGTGTNKWLITAGWVNSTGGSGGSGEMVYDGNTYKFNVYFDEDGADSYISIPDLKWWSEKHKFAVKGKSISVNDYFLISKYGTNPHILELSRIKNATTEKSINVKEIGKETNTWTITETFDIPKPGGKGEMVYDGIRYAFTVDFGSSETDADDKIDVELKNETETKSCSDGTPSGECSAERKFCDSGNLFDDCSRCYCPAYSKCDAAGKEAKCITFCKDAGKGGSDKTKATTAEQQGLKAKGYIVEFREKPLIKYNAELENKAKFAKAAGIASEAETPESAGKHKQKLIEEHRKALGEIKQQVTITGAATESSEGNILGEYFNVFNGIALDISAEEAEKLKKLDSVKAVYKNEPVEALLSESIPLLDADLIWKEKDSNDNYLKGKGITIAIIDTGVDYTHPDLGGCLGYGCKVIGGYDFVNDDEDPMDDHMHGTHVASTAAGIKGVAPEANIIAYKVLNYYGGGYEDDIIAAIETSADPNGDGDFSDKADIISMSLGFVGGNPDDPTSWAVDNIVDSGVIAVIAAGNEGDWGYQTIRSPGTARKAITVGAVNKCDAIAYFSSKGPVITEKETIMKPDIVAPGVDINAAIPGGGYESASGTSMATPHAAGAVALILQKHPGWTPLEIKQALKDTAIDLSYDKNTQGAGRIDIKKAIELKTAPKVIENCNDGTKNMECSATLPKYCYNGDLFENCNRCGCAEGNCNLESGICSTPKADLSVGISVSDTAVNKESTATVWIDNLGEADAGNTEIILYDAYEMNNFTAGFGESMAVEVPFKFKFTPYISEDSILIEASFDNMTGQFVLKRGMVAEIKSGFLFMLSEVNEDGIKAKAAKVIVTKNPLGKIPGKVSMQKGISFTPIAVGEHGIFAFLNTSTADSDWQNNYEGWKIKVKGEGPDISVNIPWTTLTVNKTNEIKAEIYDVGTEPAMNISVKLYERKWAGKGYDEKLIGETVIDKISPPASILLFSYKPEEIGYVNLILTAEPIKDVDMDNNRDELPVDVVYDAPNVGIILNSPAPEELKVNIPINISVNIANYGAKEAKDVKLYLYESERGKGEENLISKVTINEILPKGYDWAAFEWTPKTKGKRILRAVVNSTEDADLGNNEDKIYVTVGTEKADIAVSFSEFEEETEINSTSYIVIALENLGSEKARDIAISAYDGPSRIWNDSLKEAAPQKTYYLGFTWTPETKGKHSLKLAADSPDDSDNSNNRDEATINVYGMVDALFNITDSEGANAVRDLIVNGPNFPFVGTLTSPTIVKVPETASEIFLVGWLSISDAAAIRFTEAVPSEDMRAVSELIENKSEDGFLIHYIYANKLNWAYNSSEFGFLKFVSEEINPKGFKILTCPEFNFKEKSCSKEWQEIEKKSIDHNDNYLSITAEVGKNQVVALAEKDSDEDGIPDSKDSDDDNDGISDEKDRVRGKGKDVKGNVKKLNVSIGGEGDAGSTNGTKKVEILEEKKRIVEFEFDFDADELDLTKISIEKQPIADRGSLYVRGISAGNKTKTLYIDKFTKSNKVCIKDAEISSISAISSSCSGDNETLAACDGSDIKGYKCEVIGSTYKISGLSNSGVVEMPEQATPAPATPSPAPSGGGSGGSGGGGGSAPIAGGTKESFMAMNMPSGTTTKTLTTEAIAVQQVSITTKKPAANVDLSVEKLSAKPFTAPEIKGKVYQYVQIAKVNLQDSDISSVKIKFKVEKSWLGAANIKEDGIVLMRLTDKWSELKTAKTSSDAVYVYYEAESPGLSYFAVAQAAEFRALAKPATETPAPAAPAISVPPIEADNMEKAKELRATRTQSRIKFSWIIPTILVSILVLAGIGALIYKKYKAPMKEYSSNKPKTEVEEYVENTLNAGYSEEQVRAALENSGWSEEEINSAFRRLGK